MLKDEKVSDIMSILFTKEGYEMLITEEKNLTEKRKETLEHLKKAREMGDLSENGYYKAAKFELGNIDRRLKELKRLQKIGKIAEVSDNSCVGIGSLVTIYDGEKMFSYKIVGELESNPLEGRLSHKSPIGRVLMGEKTGEHVSIKTPRGETRITIHKIA